MTIVIQIKGTDETAEFPDGTPPEVIKGALQRRFAKTQQPAEQPAEPSLGDFLSAGGTIAANLAGASGAGLIGAAAAPFVGADEAANIVRGTQEQVGQRFAPETEGQQAALGQISDVGESISDFFSRNIGKNVGLAQAGLATLAGQDAPEAARAGLETATGIAEQGPQQFAGEQTFQATGSPALATLAQVGPEAIAELGGAALASRAVRGARQAPGLPATGRAFDDPNLPRAQDVPGEVPLRQLTQEDINRIRLSEGSTDADLARLRLDRGRVVDDPIAGEAVDQGFREGTVSAIKQASPEDKIEFLKMSEIKQRALNNDAFADRNRPSDIVGKNTMKRIQHLQQVRSEAGKAVNRSAKDLRGQQFDFSPSLRQFQDTLDELEIAVVGGKDGPELDFSGSSIRKIGPARKAIKNTFEEIQLRGGEGALGAHKIKKFIDEIVEFGKTPKGGLSGKADSALKSFRKSISDQLNETFPEYGNANRVFSTTQEAIGDFQKAVGTRTDLLSPNANKATGQALRKIFSNFQTRTELIDALEQIDIVANDPTIRINLANRLDDLSATGGRRFTDDLFQQASFANRLDEKFGPSAGTSIAAEFAKGAREAARATTGEAKSVVVEKGVEALERLRGINDENAFKALNELLRQ